MFTYYYFSSLSLAFKIVNLFAHRPRQSRSLETFGLTSLSKVYRAAQSQSFGQGSPWATMVSGFSQI